MEILTFGEFIMNNQEWIQLGGVIATLLGVIATFISVVFVYQKKLDKIKDNTTPLSGEHSSLSKEHSSLSREHSNLTKEHALLSRDVSAIASATTFLSAEARGAKARRELATQQDLNILKIQEQLSGYTEYVAYLKQENIELKGRVRILEIKLNAYKHRELSDELEL